MATELLTRELGSIAARRAGIRRTRTSLPMRGALRALDAFFRRPDTLLARVLRGLSSSSGTLYAASATKRALDLVVGVPLAAIAILLILLLIVVNKLLYPRERALFRQDRVGRAGGRLRVIKIRSMISRRSSDAAPGGAAICTAFGRLIRQHYLDELPQLLQVLTGRLSLVGIRALPQDVYDGLRLSWSDRRFETWRAMYCLAPLGLTGTHQVFRRGGKEDERRFHHDMFYARHASLGFDLYLLWRTLGSRDTAHTSRSPNSPGRYAMQPREATTRETEDRIPARDRPHRGLSGPGTRLQAPRRVPNRRKKNRCTATMPVRMSQPKR